MRRKVTRDRPGLAFVWALSVARLRKPSMINRVCVIAWMNEMIQIIHWNIACRPSMPDVCIPVTDGTAMKDVRPKNPARDNTSRVASNWCSQVSVKYSCLIFRKANIDVTVAKELTPISLTK